MRFGIPSRKIRGIPRYIAPFDSDDTHPPTTGPANSRPGYTSGYRPEVGLIPVLSLLQQENADFVLLEDGNFIKL